MFLHTKSNLIISKTHLNNLLKHHACHIVRRIKFTFYNEALENHLNLISLRVINFTAMEACYGKQLHHSSTSGKKLNQASHDIPIGCFPIAMLQILYPGLTHSVK